MKAKIMTFREAPAHGFRRYLFEYRHGGEEYGITIVARSPEEARERINAMNFARYIGEVKMTLNVYVPSIGWFIRRLFGRN